MQAGAAAVHEQRRAGPASSVATFQDIHVVNPPGGSHCHRDHLITRKLVLALPKVWIVDSQQLRTNSICSLLPSSRWASSENFKALCSLCCALLLLLASAASAARNRDAAHAERADTTRDAVAT